MGINGIRNIRSSSHSESVVIFSEERTRSTNQIKGFVKDGSEPVQHLGSV